MVREDAQRKKIEIVFSLDDSVTMLTADERRLKQILVNLLSNAVKFTPSGGKVGLKVVGDHSTRKIRFSVWDRGIGISDDDLPRLFQPFVQLDVTLSRRYEGTGLGLSLVKRLVELHGGSVQLESEIKKGSRFTVELPWIGDEGVDSPEPNGKDHGARPASPRALVPTARRPIIVLVEDSQTSARGLADYLEFKGYHVAHAASGEDGIALVGLLTPAIVLTDLQLPGIDGLEVIRQIRGGKMNSVPIIALTARAMRSDRERALGAGATAHVSKPVALDELRQTIDSLIMP